MTLLILYIAHSLIGLWGMLLGVPIAVCIYRYLILNGAKRENGPAAATVEAAGEPG
jgi:predicted PurR-regulated permease PerM